MAAIKAASSKKPRSTKQKAKGKKKKRTAATEAAERAGKATTSPQRKTAGKRPTGRKELSEPTEEKKLQDEFFSHQQLFREAVEESAKLLRQAAEAALRSISEHQRPAGPELFQPNLAHAQDDPLKPLTDQFVEKAYERARNMFEEIDSGGTHSVPPGTRLPFPSVQRPSDRPAEDALAASALLMNQATQYLNVAIDSVMKEMDRRLSAQAANIRSHEATAPRPKRP